MKMVIKTFSQKEEHKDVDSTVVVIMSHGASGDKCYGSDGEHVDYADIIDMFNNCNCPNLKDKPKMFFIQACRGDKWDFGEDVNTRRDSHPTGQEAEQDCKLPLLSDVLIAFGTMPGCLAYRDTVYGAWFIESLVKILLDNAHNTHVVDMLTMVADLLVKRKTDSGTKQGSETILRSWRRQLYFYPERR